MSSNKFFKIINWRKLIYLILIQLLFKICFLYDLGFETTISSFFIFFLLSFATVTMLASGYLISYYNKYKFDRVEEKVAKKAYSLGIFCSIISIILVTFVSISIGKPYHSFISVIIALLLIAYLHYNTDKDFLSIVLEPCINALCIFIIWWFDTPVNTTDEQWEEYFNFQLIAIVYIFLSIVGNIVYQIIKDIVNFNNDYIKNIKTLPVLLGRRRGKSIALFFTVTGCLTVLGFAISCIDNIFILSIIFFMGTIPELCLIYLISKANTEKEFKKVLKMSNLTYLLGIVSIPLVAYYFRYAC